MFDPIGRCVGGLQYCLFYFTGFFTRETTKHIVRYVPTFRGGSDSQPQARHFLASQPSNYVHQPLLTSGRPFRSKPHLSDRQAQVVADNQNVTVIHFVKVAKTKYATSTVIHVGMRPN